MKTPKQFFSEKKLKKYAIEHRFKATAWDVSMSRLYHQINPEYPLMKEGKKYSSLIKPIYYFKYKCKDWPVYEDDAGQCEYIYVNDKTYSAGTYVSYPFSVQYFMEIINEQFSEKNTNSKK